MTLEKFNEFHKAIIKYIPDDLSSDDDLTLIMDCLGEIRRNYVLKKAKYVKQKNKDSKFKDF